MPTRFTGLEPIDHISRLALATHGAEHVLLLLQRAQQLASRKFPGCKGLAPAAASAAEAGRHSGTLLHRQLCVQ